MVCGTSITVTCHISTRFSLLFLLLVGMFSDATQIQISLELVSGRLCTTVKKCHVDLKKFLSIFGVLSKNFTKHQFFQVNSHKLPKVEPSNNLSFIPVVLNDAHTKFLTRPSSPNPSPDYRLFFNAVSS